jgi:hypothetical protein
MTDPNGSNGKHRILGRADILGVNDQQYTEVAVPEWGTDPEDPPYVRIKGLTARERDHFEESVAGQGSKKMNFENIRARFLALVCVDENNKSLFTDADIPLLGMKSAAALNRVFTIGSKMSGLTTDDVDSLAKNSGRALGGARSSSLPSTS